MFVLFIWLIFKKSWSLKQENQCFWSFSGREAAGTMGPLYPRTSPPYCDDRNPYWCSMGYLWCFQSVCWAVSTLTIFPCTVFSFFFFWNIVLSSLKLCYICSPLMLEEAGVCRIWLFFLYLIGIFPSSLFYRPTTGGAPPPAAAKTWIHSWWTKKIFCRKFWGDCFPWQENNSWFD